MHLTSTVLRCSEGVDEEEGCRRGGCMMDISSSRWEGKMWKGDGGRDTEGSKIPNKLFLSRGLCYTYWHERFKHNEQAFLMVLQCFCHLGGRFGSWWFWRQYPVWQLTSPTLITEGFVLGLTVIMDTMATTLGTCQKVRDCFAAVTAKIKLPHNHLNVFMM